MSRVNHVYWAPRVTAFFYFTKTFNDSFPNFPHFVNDFRSAGQWIITINPRVWSRLGSREMTEFLFINMIKAIRIIS